MWPESVAKGRKMREKKQIERVGAASCPGGGEGGDPVVGHIVTPALSDAILCQQAHHPNASSALKL